LAGGAAGGVVCDDVTDDAVRTLLLRTNHLLQECDFNLRFLWLGGDDIPDQLFEAVRSCDEAERKAPSGDSETAATIAILRSMAASFALRHHVHFELESEFEDDGGTWLNGLEEIDEAGLSRPLTERSIAAARAALSADPWDALVPLHLGHALTWFGDREGAVAAFEEALRRDPRDGSARFCLEQLEAAPPAEPAPEESPREMSHGQFGFAMICDVHWLNNNDSDDQYWLFGNIHEACDHVHTRLGLDIPGLTEADREDGPWREYAADNPVLQIHRPGYHIIQYDLRSRIQTGPDHFPTGVDWSDISLDGPLGSPLPPGRPLRINDRTCF
jgi:tetratricopeptide (TPR) repeat protein